MKGILIIVLVLIGIMIWDAEVNEYNKRLKTQDSIENIVEEEDTTPIPDSLVCPD